MAFRPSSIAAWTGTGLIGAELVLAAFTASAGATAPKPTPRAPSSAPVSSAAPTTAHTPPRPVPTVSPSRSGVRAPRTSSAPIGVPAGGGPASASGDGAPVLAISLLASGAVLIGGGAFTVVRRRS